MKAQFLFSLYFLIASISLLSLTQDLHSAPFKNISVRIDPELAFSLEAIQALPEGKALLSRILTEGPLTIAVGKNDVVRDFSACWDSDSRTILIGLFSRPTRGEVIGSLIFELQNALVSSQFDKLNEKVTRGKLSKVEYIRAMEYLEYVNSINASKLAKIGIQKGLLPKSACLPTYKNFEEHFYYQKVSGHSDIIGWNYDLLVQ
ncbi:MAG: hypothetical protein H0T62_05910 [Parachlamydiaceae bacterium]|nr:hypothetical protein [Parachlamydiaceae bacterium]